MGNEHSHLEVLFEAARKLQGAERTRFLEEKCPANKELLCAVEALLQEEDGSFSLLDEPVGRLAAQILPQLGTPSWLPGKTIGPYKILGLAGAGGMGEVYRVWDSKLKRNVAVKVLPAEFSRDPERISRFQREAEVLASLNHPRVAAIYDLQDFEESRCLVLELVEGETLAECLRRGPVSTKEAVGIARQIADALEAAHSKGIVHRDLKPSNIKITPEGHVKVLDFGLAKVFEQTDGPVHPSGATMDSASTTSGLMGTPAYMSPEQARGLDVDNRTDIWAFGCVLYEMLTGRRVFHGATSWETLRAVATEEPDLTHLPSKTPAKVRALIRRCLQKDPKMRLSDIGTARLELDAMESALEQKTLAPYLWLTAVLATAAILVVLFRGARAPGLSNIEKQEINPPDGVTWGELPPDPSPRASPNGQYLVFAGSSQKGIQGIWLQTVSTKDVRLLPETADLNSNTSLFWSPDSRKIAYCLPNSGTIKKVDIQTELSEQIAAPCTGDGSWSAQGEILFRGQMGLARVPQDGGPVTPVTSLDSKSDNIQDYPRWLPDGQHFFFTWRGSDSKVAGIHLGDIKTGKTARVLTDVSAADYVQSSSGKGYLVFVRDEVKLVAVPVQSGSFTPLDDAVVLADRMQLGISRRTSASAVAPLLVYRNVFQKNTLVFVDRQNNPTGRQYGGETNISSMDLSPDGKTIAYSSYDLDTGFWKLSLLDIKTGDAKTLYAPKFLVSNPVFSPDGQRLAFSSNASGRSSNPRILTIDGSPEPSEPLTKATFNVADWCGDTILGANPNTILSVKEGQPPQNTEVVVRNAIHPKLSSHCDWLAYTSLESGERQVYVQHFPDGAQKTPITTTGGSEPFWNGDDSKLYYLTGSGAIWEVPIQLGAKVTPRPPKRLINERVRPATNYTRRDFVATQDGETFLINVQSSQPAPLTVVRNWLADVEK